MNLTLEQSQKFIEQYKLGRFRDLDDRMRAQTEQECERVIWEIDHPTEKISDDPDAVLVPMGHVSFTTSLSQSPKLKTFAIGSCLGLITSGSTMSRCTNQIYTSGSLSHVAATLDTDGLLSKIISKHNSHRVSPEEINFQIQATGSVDTKLLAEVKRVIYHRTGQRNVKEDIRFVQSTNLLYNFETGKVYEIPELNLTLPEYKKPFMIPPAHMPYEVIDDPRTNISLERLYQLCQGSNSNKNIKELTLNTR